MRVVYLVFLFSAFLLTGLFKSPSEVLKAPGGEEFSEPRRIAHYVVVAVIAIGSGWYSTVQVKKDWASLKKKMKDRKNKRDER